MSTSHISRSDNIYIYQYPAINSGPHLSQIHLGFLLLVNKFFKFINHTTTTQGHNNCTIIAVTICNIIVATHSFLFYHIFTF